jgi:hypothetical protein
LTKADSLELEKKMMAYASKRKRKAEAMRAFRLSPRK